MNIRKDYAGIQRDVTWDDINYTPLANRGFIHALGKTISGDTDYILQGCVFSKIAATSGTVTAGYVYDSTSGEVVQVDAQTVTETLGTNLWTLVKTTTYDSAGQNLYRDGALKDNYQQERMVLTNVASIGSGFDVEHTDSYDAWREISNSDITFEAEWSEGGDTSLRYRRIGDMVHFIGLVDADTSGSWVAANNWEIQIPKADYFDVEPSDATNNVTSSIGQYQIISDSIDEPCTVSFSDTDATNLRILFNRASNGAATTFPASKSHRFHINATIRIK